MKSTSQRVKRSSRHSEGSPAATSMARLSDYFDNDDPADFIQLSVLPDVDLELLRVDSNAASDQGNPGRSWRMNVVRIRISGCDELHGPRMPDRARHR